MNAYVLKHLKPKKGVDPGQVRRAGVKVGDYTPPRAEECQPLLEKMCEWLDSRQFANNPRNPESSFKLLIMKAILAHVYINLIHPFGDGNGRTARALELQILAGGEIPETAIHLLTNHYNQTRADYYRNIARTNQSSGGVYEFIEYAVRGFEAGLDEQVREVRKSQSDNNLKIGWENLVRGVFAEQLNGSAAARRRMAVALQLPLGEKTHISEIRHLTARLQEAYRGKTEKTLTRDLNALEEMGLLCRLRQGHRHYVEPDLAQLRYKRRISIG